MLRFGILPVLVLTMVLGCTPVAPTPPEPPIARSFNYTPQEQANQLLPVTIALVQPLYTNPTRESWNQRWSKDTGDAFVSSMQTDLQKILIAKGFKVTGPYNDLNSMTFPEKKGANLTLTPTIDIRAQKRVTNERPPSRSGEIIVITTPGIEEGVLTVGGNVSLVMLEPLSGEKMWLKRVEVESTEEPYEVKYSYSIENGRQIMNTYNDTRERALTKALNRIYPAAMQQMWIYFHPEEVQQINKEANDLRERKRY